MCSPKAALNESLISDTNRERLVFCYSVRWYELFFEIAAPFGATDSPRNHVVCLAILFSCQRTDFRRRAARLPDPSVRVKRNVSTLFVKPFRLTRTPVTAVASGKSSLQDRSAGTKEFTSRPPLCQPSRRELSQPLTPTPYSTVFAAPGRPSAALRSCTNCCATSSYRSFFRRSGPA
jgi:hypothetical protein